MTEAQEPTVTETTEATPAPDFHQEQVKKPRTPAQMAALEAARQKAFAIRAEKKRKNIASRSKSSRAGTRRRRTP